MSATGARRHRYRRVWDYIADDSVARADAWVDRLDETLMLLSTRPLMGRDRHSLAHGLRSHPFGRYIIFYTPCDDGREVVRLLYSARDIDTSFADDQ